MSGKEPTQQDSGSTGKKISFIEYRLEVLDEVFVKIMLLEL
jgi:hypothetical protein